MVGVIANSDSNKIAILGYGISIDQPFELSPDILLSPSFEHPDFKEAADACPSFKDYAAVLLGREVATFTLEVTHSNAPKELVAKSWNSLWLFHLLAVACRSPCLSLYSVCDGAKPTYASTGRTPFIRALPNIHAATKEELLWARDRISAFDNLVQVHEFSYAMRCYANSFYLMDDDVRVMLLWAGIEGLLSVDAELSRRIALYSAILFDGSEEDKLQHFDRVKRAYTVRSTAVHGGSTKTKKLRDGVTSAEEILIGLLSKCVDLGRVPTPSELDRASVAGAEL